MIKKIYLKRKKIYKLAKYKIKCDKINKSKSNRNLIKKNTGLALDTYFPAPKLIQLLNLNNKFKEKLKNGSALFGTIDTYLIYRLTKQKSYTTDFTNAS